MRWNGLPDATRGDARDSAPFRRRLVRAATAGLVALGTLVTTSLPVSAHAELVSSSPAANQALGTAPGAVVLEFSEGVNPRLSSATVIDPSGHRWPGQVTAAQEIRVPLETNLQGVYSVDWSSVSLLDGHHVTGSFAFGVRVSTAALAGAHAAMLGQPSSTDVLIGAVKWIEALALIALLGQLLVVGLARRSPPLGWVRSRFALASIPLSAGMVVVWTEATTATGGHSLTAYAIYFTTGVTGFARLARLASEIVIVIAAIRPWRTTLWVSVGAALIGVAASGHAANVQPGWLGIVIDALHLAAAGIWAGGILALATQRPPGGWRSADGHALLDRFTLPALTAFAVTVGAGAILAVQQIGSWTAFTGSAYGRVLIAKILLIGLMLPLSFAAWRLRRPRLRIEASLAAAVVGAAALLAAFPAPPTQAAQVLAALASTPSNIGLPSPGQLTLGGDAGSVLVGLSLDPGLVGPNRIRVYLLPPDGNAAASTQVANVSVEGVAGVPDITKPLISCGATCRQTTLTLLGGATVNVDVLGPGGGQATFVVPSLPAPSGASLLALMQRRMHQLHSYQVSESLSSGLTTVLSTYSAAAPDRTTWSVDAMSETIYIGTTLYSRESRDQPWTTQTAVPEDIVPSFVWDYFAPLTDAHVIGHQSIGGVPTTEVSAFGNKQATAIWFRFWIDATGLVRRAQMTAPGHFMIDDYVGLNVPVDITAP
jgi:copper transport protein